MPSRVDVEAGKVKCFRCGRVFTDSFQFERSFRVGILDCVECRVRLDCDRRVEENARRNPTL